MHPLVAPAPQCISAKRCQNESCRSMMLFFTGLGAVSRQEYFTQENQIPQIATKCSVSTAVAALYDLNCEANISTKARVWARPIA
jgi:hypothetical protein